MARSQFLLCAGFLACASLLISNPLSAANAAAPAPEGGPYDIVVAGRSIKVPAPEGFVRIDGISPELDAAQTAVLPASNRQLINFSTEEVRRQIAAGSLLDMPRNFNIQTVKSIESTEMGDRTFTSVRGEMKKGLDQMHLKLDSEMKKITEAGNSKLKDQFGVDAALKFSDTAVLGFFDESPTRLGFTMAMKVEARGETPQRRVAAGMMVPVNGRLLNLYATADFESEADRQWAEAAVTKWCDALVAANPKVIGSPFSSLGFDFSKVTRSTLIGALIGGLVGLVAWFAKKFKKAS